MPPTNKINWREKPKRWEFILIAIVAIATIAQLIWLFSLWQSDTVQHKSKLEKIETWKSSMLSTAPRAGQCLARLTVLDGQILSLTESSGKEAKTALEAARKNWSPGTMRRLVEVLPFVADKETGKNIEALLEEECGQSFADINKEKDKDKWYALCQAQKATEEDKTYVDFKALLYRRLNPTFSEYFGQDRVSTVDPFELRLSTDAKDEASLLTSSEATSPEESALKDDDIVYGAEIDGEFRAYTRTFLQSNSIFYDRLGKSDITGVYEAKTDKLTLYDTSEMQPRRFAKSGFSYRKEPLLMDIGARSLWQPSSGNVLVSAQERIDYDQQNPLSKRQLPVDKTTWSKWLGAHPKTSVLVVSI